MILWINWTELGGSLLHKMSTIAGAFGSGGGGAMSEMAHQKANIQ